MLGGLRMKKWLHDYQNLIGLIFLGICVLIAGDGIAAKIEGAGINIQGGLGSVMTALIYINDNLYKLIRYLFPQS